LGDVEGHGRTQQRDIGGHRRTLEDMEGTPRTWEDMKGTGREDNGGQGRTREDRGIAAGAPEQPNNKPTSKPNTAKQRPAKQTNQTKN